MKTGVSSLWRSVVLLCLPTFVALVMGAYFFVTDYPEIKREENNRYSAELESFAERLESSDKLEFVWQRGAGVVRGDKSWENEFPPDGTWKSWKPVDGTKKKEMWGWRDTPQGRLVWRRSTGKDDSLVFAAIADIEKSGVSDTILVLGIFVVFGLIFTTFVGVKFFVDYIRTRDDFMAATAHDLTTPLVAMRYMIGKNDAEALTLCERMMRLVANIKDFLRLGGRRPKAKSEKFDLVKAYEEAYSLFREDYRDAFDGSDVPFRRGEGVASEGPVFVKGDETMAVQIIWNLLGNDLKYAAPYGKVEVVVRAKDGIVEIAFADEGQGMTPAEMRKAFDRYYRAKTVLVSGKGGFGIGLPTAKEFAEAMGGGLSVRANNPRGCVFTLTLNSADDSTNRLRFGFFLRCKVV